MYPTSAPRDGLALLAEAFRSRRTGVLVVGEGPDAIHVRLEAGQVVALGPPAPEAQAPKLPKPSDSVHLRLERVLAEIGMRKPTEAPRLPDSSTSTPLSSASLRERLIASLAEDVRPVRFDDGAPSPEGVVAVSVVTEPLILEAVGQMRHDEAVLKAIGDLDQLLVATTALADERTLTLTEGYLLSRIDGLASARQVLELVPLDPGDVERTLLGLLLTGRVETRPAPYPRRVPAAAPLAPPSSAPPLPAAEPQAEAAHEQAMPAAEAIPESSEQPPREDPVAEPVEETVEELSKTEELPKTAPHIVGDFVQDEEHAQPEVVSESIEPPVDEPASTQTIEIRTAQSPVAEDAVAEDAAEDTVPEAAGAESPTAEYPFAASVASAPSDGPAVEAPAAESQPPTTDPMPSPPVDTAVLERRREVLEVFQSLPLKNHFEVLGVEPGCNDDEVKRAYVSLTKRFHPDAQRDKRIEDMHDILEAIFIRVQEAWEVLGEARSRASYEARSGIVRHPRGARPGQPAPPARGAASTSVPTRPAPAEYVPPEEILFQVRRLLAQARYWDAIQILESTLPGMEPRSQQHRGRLLLARAYSKNPNWLRRAEETLHELVREDPTNADAHYELGMIYKTSGFPTRAQAMFKRTLELRPGHKDASAELGIPTDGGTPRTGLLKRLFKRGGKAS
jgi:hypothetical protein